MRGATTSKRQPLHLMRGINNLCKSRGKDNLYGSVEGKTLWLRRGINHLQISCEEKKTFVFRETVKQPQYIMCGKVSTYI
jgi:hypothetical protein